LDFRFNERGTMLTWLRVKEIDVAAAGLGRRGEQ